MFMLEYEKVWPSMMIENAGFDSRLVQLPENLPRADVRSMGAAAILVSKRPGHQLSQSREER